MSQATQHSTPTALEPAALAAPAQACDGCIDRRQMLVGTGLALAAVGVLAACSSGGEENPGSTPAADGSLAKVEDVPVGGALPATDADGNKILLVQAEEGTITALTAICTHQGCTVAPGDGELACPCHGSRFSLDGAVLNGPADEPLAAVDVHVEDGAVFPGAA